MTEKSLIFVIKADITNFNNEMKKAHLDFKRNFGEIKKELDSMSRNFAVAGGAITAGLGLAVSKFTQIGDELEKALPQDKEALKNFGITIDPAMIEAGKQLQDTFRQLKLAVDLFLATVGDKVNIKGFIENLMKMVGAAMDFVNAHPEVVQAVVAIGIALGSVAAVIKGVNAALIIMNALSGPKGWIALAAGVAVAAGSLALVNSMIPEMPKRKEMYGDVDVSDMSPESKHLLGITGYASGGIVTRPTLAMVGEAGPEAVVPLSGGGFGGSSLTVNVGNFMGDELSLRQFARTIKRVWEEENNRSSFAPTKTDYYSPGGHM